MKTWLACASMIACLTTFSPMSMAADTTRPTPAAHRAHMFHPIRTAPEFDADSERPTHHWEVKSSVQISREALRDAYTASRDAYTRKLQRFAKCSPGEAKKAVLSAHPGMTIENLQLRNVRTSLVYMAVTGDDEDKYLVLIDAGNGKVLLDKPLPTHHERVFADH